MASQDDVASTGHFPAAARDGFVTVGVVADFPLGIGRPVTVGRRQLAIFRLDDGIFAIDNLCLHQAGPLCDGFVEHGAVTCPWHGWSYDLRTGILVQDGKMGVASHPTRVIGDVVQVRLA
jgi:nitrite reductase/ring-hydroxylating ferredoxin subunit